ncbi:hypothetical protein RI129_002983 [Pyrocoelia pectoralis]|uniref:DDE Tnp4 domain-containing protein n=1 Tax=Pyrocoelia pectoralis TaxID=417401 RepID=A0AAN7VN20_9COLE
MFKTNMRADRFIENLERYDSSDEDDFPRPRKVLNRANYFDTYDDVDFFRRFRITKPTTLLVFLLIKLFSRNSCVSPINQLLLALRFYATGSHLLNVGDFCGVSVSTSCRIVRRVSNAIANLRPRYINFPSTDIDKNAQKQQFYDIANFPNVIGTIDCTHVKIQSPGGEDAEIFRNRKGYFSLNVQTISSANLEVEDIVCRWPGSTHAAAIFQNSRVFHDFETGMHPNCILLGDSGYPLKHYLMTPFLNPTTSGQVNYNRSQITTRNTVERQYGVLKRRFPILAMGIRQKLETATSIIIACCVLHNICIREREEQPPEDVENLINLINNGQT